MPVPESLSAFRLLIVDDDPQLAEFLREALKTRFSLIVVAAGLAQAKGVMDGPFVFHAVVCDYQLNDGTGGDFYHWLRHTRRDAMPFVMISGHVAAREENDPAFGFLAKPFLPSTLCELLQELQARSAATHPVP